MKARNWPEHWAPPDEKSHKKSNIIWMADGDWRSSEKEYFEEYRGTIKTASIRGARRLPPPPARRRRSW